VKGETVKGEGGGREGGGREGGRRGTTTEAKALLQRQKRPTIEVKETHCKGKRDLLSRGRR
jgi:hypothetical protein